MQWLAYILTLGTTFLVIAVLPVVLVVLAIEYRRSGRVGRQLAVAACVELAFLACAFLAWEFRPFPWSLSFADTIRASFGDPRAKYPAERVLLFVLMSGAAGAWVVFLTAFTISRRPRQQGRVH